MSVADMKITMTFVNYDMDELDSKEDDDVGLIL